MNRKKVPAELGGGAISGGTPEITRGTRVLQQVAAPAAHPGAAGAEASWRAVSFTFRKSSLPVPSSGKFSTR